MPPERRFASAIERLTPEEQLACRRDVIEYGSCFIFERDDGTVYRVPPVRIEDGVEGQLTAPERWWKA